MVTRGGEATTLDRHPPPQQPSFEFLIELIIFFEFLLYLCGVLLACIKKCFHFRKSENIIFSFFGVSAVVMLTSRKTKNNFFWISKFLWDSKNVACSKQSKQICCEKMFSISMLNSETHNQKQHYFIAKSPNNFEFFDFWKRLEAPGLVGGAILGCSCCATWFKAKIFFDFKFYLFVKT